MSRSGIWIIRTVSFLLLIAVLAVGGWMLFQAGQAQGYALGAAGGPEQALPQNAAPFAFSHGYVHYFPFGPILGLLFFGGLIFVVFGLVGGLLRSFFWHSWGGPYHRGWDRRAWRHAWRHGGPYPYPYPPYPWGPEMPEEGPAKPAGQAAENKEPGETAH
ncbi:MAG: hypothetical protein GYA17_13725 [Chloroflexi bacterium]|jgi:hypothetical protein|nr:hypothetical protein [Chloroflexota bacterium]